MHTIGIQVNCIRSVCCAVGRPSNASTFTLTELPGFTYGGSALDAMMRTLLMTVASVNPEGAHDDDINAPRATIIWGARKRRRAIGHISARTPMLGRIGMSFA